MPDKSGNFFNGIGLVDLEKFSQQSSNTLNIQAKIGCQKRRNNRYCYSWRWYVRNGCLVPTCFRRHSKCTYMDKSTKEMKVLGKLCSNGNSKIPKDLTGPAFGHGALTFQSWYRAQYGEDSWNSLDKILRPMWMDYLKWYRSVLKIPIENGLSLNQVKPVEGNILKLKISGNNGNNNETIFCRKLIFATGRDGIGCPNMPNFVDSLPKKFWAHSSDDIDFNTLAKKNVAVIGVGASAVDNAAEALEHGEQSSAYIEEKKCLELIR